MNDDLTRTITLWSETQLELLTAALEKNKSGAHIIGIVKDLISRGLPAKYLVDKARDKVGMQAASRLNRITSNLK